MHGRIVILATAIALFSQSGCIKPSQQKRMIVSLPERWPAGEQRDCVVTADDPVSKLPHLDCDLLGKHGPERLRSTGVGAVRGMAVKDVKFSTTPERMLYVEWVCKPKNDSLVCTN